MSAFTPPTKDFDPAPQGAFPGRCIHIIDLGTHNVMTMGQPKPTRQLRVTFELPTEKKVFDEEKGEQPFTLSLGAGGGVTCSMSEKANLRKALESWRGSKFNDEDIAPFVEKGIIALKPMLGKSAMITITHSAKGDKTYANITGLSRLPKGLECPPLVNPLMFFSLEPENFSIEDFNKLNDNVKKKIMNSPEYKLLATSNEELRKSNANKPQEEPPKDHRPSRTNPDPDLDVAPDDIPF